MKRLLILLYCLAFTPFCVCAQDITQLTKIGRVAGFTRNDNGVTVNCEDGSQVRFTILAPDLIRIRASFKSQIPQRDHSWAIAKTDWSLQQWKVTESADLLSITTDEVEVIVHRTPLLIDFRDARSHQLLNADEQPMAYDSNGLLREIMFDPSAGMFVAVSKKLGFDEHFYGLGEKA